MTVELSISGEQYMASLVESMPRVAAGVERLQPEIAKKIAELTQALIAVNDENARGGIKALQWLLELPVQLQSELDHLKAGLSDTSDPD